MSGQHRAYNTAKTIQDPILIAEWTEPSLGYVPLLMEMGWDQLTARGLAKFVVRQSKRRANEGKPYQQVLKDIQFLAKRPRRRDAVLRCAKRLNDAARTTPIVGDRKEGVRGFASWLVPRTGTFSVVYFRNFEMFSLSQPDTDRGAWPVNFSTVDVVSASADS
jgi:hypothetical protein